MHSPPSLRTLAVLAVLTSACGVSSARVDAGPFGPDGGYDPACPSTWGAARARCDGVDAGCTEPGWGCSYPGAGDVLPDGTWATAGLQCWNTRAGFTEADGGPSPAVLKWTCAQ